MRAEGSVPMRPIFAYWLLVLARPTANFHASQALIQLLKVWASFLVVSNLCKLVHDTNNLAPLPLSLPGAIPPPSMSILIVIEVLDGVIENSYDKLEYDGEWSFITVIYLHHKQTRFKGCKQWCVQYNHKGLSSNVY